MKQKDMENWWNNSEALEEKPVSWPLAVPQIPHVLAYDRNQNPAVSVSLPCVH